MKKYFSFFILIMIPCTVFASEKTRLTDSEISELLIGTWRIMLSDKSSKLDAVDEAVTEHQGTFEFIKQFNHLK